MGRKDLEGDFHSRKEKLFIGLWKNLQRSKRKDENSKECWLAGQKRNAKTGGGGINLGR
jgi:hypothetical protein